MTKEYVDSIFREVLRNVPTLPDAGLFVVELEDRSGCWVSFQARDAAGEIIRIKDIQYSYTDDVRMVRLGAQVLAGLIEDRVNAKLLADALPVEMAKVADLISTVPDHDAYLMRADLEAATLAIAAGSTVAMMKINERLREWLIRV